MIHDRKPAPKKVPFYEEKMLYLSRVYSSNCAIARAMGEKAKITELHHALIHNTEPNRRRFPLLIHSVINLKPVNHNRHMANPSWGIITPEQAELFEQMLEDDPVLACYVNTLSWEE